MNEGEPKSEDGLEGEAAELRDRIAQIETESAQARENLSEMMRENEEMMKKVREMRERREKVEETSSTTPEPKPEQEKGDLVDKKVHIKKLEEEMIDLAKRRYAKEEEIPELKKANPKDREKLRKTSAELESLKQNIKRLKKEIGRLKIETNTPQNSPDLQTEAETPKPEAEAQQSHTPEVLKLESEEEIAIEKEIKELPTEDKEKLSVGLGNVGFIVEKKKNDFFAKVFSWIAEKNLDQKKTTTRFLRKLSAGFLRDAKIAQKKAEDVVNGKAKRRMGNVGNLFGNVLRYGRVVTDLLGNTLASPLRYVMMAGMVSVRASEAAKETRLENEEVIEKTRIIDAERAAEEAWNIYEQAQKKAGGENISAESLKDAYIMGIPKDMQKRLEDTTVANSFIQGVLRKSIESNISKFNEKIEDIENNKKLTKEQKEKKKEKLIKKWEEALVDYDRVLTRHGEVDELAMAGRYAQTVSKAVVTVVTIETILLSVEKIFESVAQVISSTNADIPEKPFIPYGPPAPETAQDSTFNSPLSRDPDHFLSRIQGVGVGPDSTTIADSTTQEQVDSLVQAKADSVAQADSLTKLQPDSTAKIDSLAQAKIDSLAQTELKPDSTVVIDSTKIVTPPQPAGAGIAASVAQAIEQTPGKGHEIVSNFSLKLGEGGVPKNLETVFHGISADQMDLAVGGTIDEEFATKSLNMAANLVRLTEGHGVIGIDAEKFAETVSFENGVLQIKDHVAFNEILEKLQTHSGELWDKGVLQGKGAAITHIPSISEDGWLKIVHADGLDKGLALDGTPDTATGILGHDEITPDAIKNFSESELVKNAIIEKTILEENTSDITLPSEPDLEIARPGVESPEILDAAAEAKKRLLESYEGNPESVSTGATAEQAGIETRADAINEFANPSPEETILRAEEIHKNNLSDIFSGDLEKDWHVLAEQPAKTFLKMDLVAATNKDMLNFVSYIHKLQDLADGLRPKTGFLGLAPEDTGDYMERVLRFIAINHPERLAQIKPE